MSHRLLLWAQVDPLDFGRNFRAANANFQWSNVVLLLAIVAAIAFGVWLLVRVANEREGRAFRHPGKLFRELCQAHQLDRPSRKLLRRLAGVHRLKQPSLLFLDPEWFDVARLDASWSAQRGDLESLRDHIFGQKLSEHTVEA